jgi:uncharacterized Zn-finger protein
MRIITLVKRSAGRPWRRLCISRSHMGPFETIYINETIAACNGGGGPLGHPRVYLNLAPAGKTECPYCSRLFVNRAVQGANAPGPAKAPGEAITPPKASESRNA